MPDNLGFVPDDDLGFVPDHDLGFKPDGPESVDLSGTVMPRGMEHLDPAHPEAYEQAFPSEHPQSTNIMDAWSQGAQDPNNPITRGKEWLQGHVGRPLIEPFMGMAGFVPDAPLPGNMSLAHTPEAALAQSATSAYTGREPDESALAALANATGSTGESTPSGPQVHGVAKALTTAADLAGQAPLYEAGSALLPSVPITAASRLGRAGVGALKGAASGAALGAAGGALSKDSTAAQGALGGAVLGGALGGLGGALEPRPIQNPLIEIPRINETLLRARLENEARQGLERAQGIEFDPEQYHSLSTDHAELERSEAKEFKNDELPKRLKQASADTAAHLENDLAPLPQVAQDFRNYKGAGPKTVASPGKIAQAINSSVAPPPTNMPPVRGLPVPPIAPGVLPKAHIDAAADIADWVKLASQAGPGRGQQIINALVAPGLRGDPGLRPLINAKRVATSLAAQGNDIIASIESGIKAGGSLPKQLDRAWRTDLGLYAKGNITLEDIMGAYPDKFPKVRALIDSHINEIQQNDQLIAALGGRPEDPSWMNDPTVSKYAARSYLSRIDPDRWQKVWQSDGNDLVEKGVRRILKDNGWEKATPEIKERVASDVVRMLTGGGDFESAAKDASWGRPYQNLKSRSNLAPEVRAMLGEVQDGPLVIAHTLGTQRAILASLQASHDIAIRPEFASAIPVIDGHGAWQQVPPLASFGQLKGMYVRPDVWEGIGGMGRSYEKAPAWTNQLLRFWKSNVTMGNLASWVHRFFLDMNNSMLSGGLDITRPVSSGKAFMQFDKALRAYFRDSTSPAAQDVLELYRSGAADMGFARAELTGAHQRMLDAMSREFKANDAQSLFGIMDSLKGIMSSGSRIYGKASQAWDMVALHMRGASYVNLRDKFILSGMDPQAARELAAQRVIMSFPSPHNLGPAVDKFRSSGFAVANPMASIHAEQVRIWAQIPQRVAEGESDLLPRMATHYGLLLAGIGGAAAYGMHKYGVSLDEMRAANAEITQAQGYHRPAQLAVPIRDSKGRVVVMDFGWLHPSLNLAQGMSTDPLYSRLATNLFMFPFDSSPAEQPMRNLIQQAGGPQAPPENQLRPGEAGLLTLLNSMNQMGIAGPVAASRMATIAKQAGMAGHNSPFQEVLTPGEAASTATGFSAKGVTVGPGPQMAARAVEFSRRMDDLKKSMGQAIMAGDADRVGRLRAMIEAATADFKSVQEKVSKAKK